MTWLLPLLFTLWMMQVAVTLLIADQQGIPTSGSGRALLMPVVGLLLLGRDLRNTSK